MNVISVKKIRQFGFQFLARDAFIKTNLRTIAVMLVRLSVCPPGTGMHCDHMVHVSADFGLLLDRPVF